MGLEIKCEVCETVIPIEENRNKGLKPPNDLIFAPNGNFAICSETCQVKIIRASALYQVIAFIKNPSWEKFQDVFNFGEGGGYAKGKYTLMKSDPWGFICSLDNKNIQKLANCYSQN
jgi:hypothetical protein